MPPVSREPPAAAATVHTSAFTFASSIGFLQMYYKRAGYSSHIQPLSQQAMLQEVFQLLNSG